MKILCLVKFTPDVDAFEYDHEKHVLIRDKGKQIINPDDACALGFALKLKKQRPEEIQIEVVSMAPESAAPLMEEILRRRIEKGTLLSDPKFGGSDTLATSRILGTYLRDTDWDVILTGDHSVDGDTAHIPAQLAEIMGLPQIASVVKIDEASFLAGAPQVEVDNDRYLETYEASFPLILSVSRTSKIRLPFVRYADLNLDVSDRLQILNAEALGLDPEQIGAAGSPTKVVSAWTRTYEEKSERVFVKNDPEGVEVVCQFLKDRGYLS